MTKLRAKTTGTFGFALFTLLWLNAKAVLPLRAEVLYSPINGLVRAKQRASAIGCADHLKSILLGSHVWSMDHADTAPPGLAVLTNELPSPAVLFCPANALAKPPTNWAELNWNQIDYTWMPNVNWSDPSDVACVCRVHEHVGLVEGNVKMGAYRPGWPWFIAGPVEALATPGETVRFDVEVTATALQPLAYQWRREEVRYETNVVRVTNPDDPRGIYWQTNVVPVFTVTLLPDRTNATLLLSSVQTNDSGFYSVAVSNALGMATSPRGRLHVDASFAGMTTNEIWSRSYCVNNLQQFALLSQIWAVDHQEQLPQSLTTLTNADGSWMFGWPASLFCRSDAARISPGEWQEVDFSNTSYELLPGNNQDPTAVFCRCRFHGFYLQRNQEVVWQPAFRRIQPAADGKTELRFQLFAGATNFLETSPDLQHWTTITNYAGGSGEFQFTDTENAIRKFYRIRQP